MLEGLAVKVFITGGVSGGGGDNGDGEVGVGDGVNCDGVGDEGVNCEDAGDDGGGLAGPDVCPASGLVAIERTNLLSAHCLNQQWVKFWRKRAHAG